MTPQQTLDQFTESINARAKEVIFASGKYEHAPSGFGLPLKKKENPTKLYCKIYEHYYKISEEYRDAGDAVNDLIKKIEAVLPKKIDEIFWRVKPGIHEDRDFDRNYPLFMARARFCVW